MNEHIDGASCQRCTGSSCVFTAKQTSRLPGRKLDLNTQRELSIKLAFQMTTLLNVEGHSAATHLVLDGFSKKNKKKTTSDLSVQY